LCGTNFVEAIRVIRFNPRNAIECEGKMHYFCQLVFYQCLTYIEGAFLIRLGSQSATPRTRGYFII